MNNFYVKINYDGSKQWFVDSILYKEEGPSIEHNTFSADTFVSDEWCLTGLLIIEWINGDKFWYLNGQLHRTDGPAKEFVNGEKYWFCHGELHRDNGPAVELVDGTKLWYLNGQPHCTSGPASEYADGAKCWYLKGKLLTKENWEKEVGISQNWGPSILKEMSFSFWHRV